MPSKSFKAKYEGECATCHQVYLQGDELFYLGYKAQGPSHYPQCPISYTPPSAASSRVEGPKELGQSVGGHGQSGPSVTGGNTDKQAFPAPAAASSRVEGPKAAAVTESLLLSGSTSPPAAPTLTVAQPAETLLKDVSTAQRVFVEVGGWVPNDRAMEVVEAIVKARRLP